MQRVGGRLRQLARHTFARRLFTLSSLMPKSSLIAWPPVRMLPRPARNGEEPSRHGAGGRGREGWPQRLFCQPRRYRRRSRQSRAGGAITAARRSSRCSHNQGRARHALRGQDRARSVAPSRMRCHSASAASRRPSPSASHQGPVWILITGARTRAALSICRGSVAMKRETRMPATQAPIIIFL